MSRESIEFVRELVNNGYDADATDVFVLINNEKIEVRDNGSGMNDMGLAQFLPSARKRKKPIACPRVSAENASGNSASANFPPWLWPTNLSWKA